MIGRQPKAMILLMSALLLFSACAPKPALAPQNKKKADAARNLGEAYLKEGRDTDALG